ncbi:hypothetical protein Ancab_038983 [Ancistrocladus abbreviatus]
MHATFQKQQGSRPSNSLNGAAVTSPLKQSPDSMQNSFSFSSQLKGKKRDCGDQAFELMKQERHLKSDDGDSGLLRSENMLKFEISKIAEKGELVDSEGVERLVQLMHSEKPQRKLDLACRSMLAGIVAVTDKFDCLSQFVQLRGLPILNKWLQEVHKGKVGDSSSPKDNDKSMEDFLLVLLCALAKLPVNITVFQTCHIGKSVNHLRSHKNSEIQKKARSLIDTWKKRVEAEMTINNVKSGSAQAVQWLGQARHEVSHGGNRHFSGSSEAAIRSSITWLSSSKSASVKLASGEMTPKDGSASVGIQKSTSVPMSTAANFKEGQTRISEPATDPSLAVVKGEKNSSSSQYHTNSQSTDHAKNMVPSGKEDARSSNAGSRSMNKITGGTSRHRKLGNGLQGPSAPGVQRETGSSGNLPWLGNNQKLIVKIPNRGRCPAQGASGRAVEDPSCRNSRASSPVLSEKQDQSEASLRDYSYNQQTKDSDGSPAAPLDKRHNRAGNDTAKSSDGLEAAYLLTGNTIKSTKSTDPSFNSINALIESCVKYSEANASMSLGDDVGMNLLASVAAGEMFRDGAVSPTPSPERNTADVDNTCVEINGKNNRLCDDLGQDQYWSNDLDVEKHNVVAGISQSNDVESSKLSSISGEDLQNTRDPSLKTSGQLNESVADGLVPGRSCCGGFVEKLPAKNASVEDESHGQVPDTKQRLDSALATEIKIKDYSTSEEVSKRAAEDISSFPSSNCDAEMNDVHHELNNNLLVEHKPPALPMRSESVNMHEEQAMVSSFTHNDLITKKSSEIKAEISDEIDACSCVDQGESQQTVQDNCSSHTPQKQGDSGLGPTASDQKTLCEDENLENKELSRTAPSALPVLEKPDLSTKTSNIPVIHEQKDACASSEVDPPGSLLAADGADGDAKLEFDLNEGFNTDDAKIGEVPSSLAAPCPTSVSLVSPLHFPVSSAAGSLPASVTVAAAAKGAFVPPEDLLKIKSELGWKGSAATSAFRPAEPRKVLEMPQRTNKASLPDATASKQVRPLLDIDLNVADERILQDFGSQHITLETGLKSNYKNGCGLSGELMSSASVHCSGGIDLDLNRIDEATELGQHQSSIGPRSEVSGQPLKLSSSRFPTDEASVKRNFDLNNGPEVEEITVEASPYSQHSHGIVPSQPPLGVKLNGTGVGNFSTWYLPGSTYSAVTTPSALPDRGDQPFPIIGIGGGHQRILSGPITSASFNPDLYKGSMLFSSPAMPFPSTPYPVFPFGTSFSLPTSILSGGSAAYLDPSSGGQLCPLAAPSQLLGTSAASSQYPHPCIVSLPDVSNNCVVESIRKLGRHGLDLNSGPGVPDVERRNGVLPVASTLLSAATSQAVVEEQTRMYHVASSKRKEPEGGWDTQRLNCKQSSWQ